VTHERERIWTAERLCFDGVASASELAPLAPATLRRFGSGRLRPAFVEEYMVRALGDCRGKHVLDIGCGRGRDSVLLAKLGARVTGLDVSAASIEFARRRAALEQVADHTAFVCSPLETAPVPPDAFDIIWCHNILHHLTDELDLVMARVRAWARPGARLMITEPVALCGALRRLREALPRGAIAATGESTWTEHERLLGAAELAALRRRVPGLMTRHFGFLGRAERFVLSERAYEQSSSPRRLLVWMLVHADYALLSLPLVRNTACRVVMAGPIAKGAALPA
jgi:SAM-dependent methyltransferase